MIFRNHRFEVTDCQSELIYSQTRPIAISRVHSNTMVRESKGNANGRKERRKLEAKEAQECWGPIQKISLRDNSIFNIPMPAYDAEKQTVLSMFLRQGKDMLERNEREIMHM